MMFHLQIQVPGYDAALWILGGFSFQARVSKPFSKKKMI